MIRILVFGALGPYTAAFTRAVAPHAQLLGCIVHRPMGGGFDYWLRHVWQQREEPGFACPVWTVGAFSETPLYEKLRKKRADLIVSCGFPRRLLAAATGRASQLGAVNLHPALLPTDRGPAPLFWCFRRGERTTAVTLHVLSEEFDAGDIIAQQPISVPRGIGGAEFLLHTGRIAGELLGRELPRLTTVPWETTPQATPTGNWARQPTHEDLEILASAWQAEPLWHYVRGARVFGALWARLGGDIYYVEDALEPLPGLKVPGDFALMGNQLVLGVKDGAVRLRVRS